ncbi:MAG: UDP-N-acetylglucosamine 2-epimerase (non-hydrolyzing), partial [Sphingomonadales bacterium]
LVHTGQHFDDNMSQIFFTELAIPAPRFNLGVGGGSHAANTGRAMEAIEDLILSEKPDWVLVYGDTDSTLAGGLAAAKLNVPIAHVEAGLRSFNRRMPEEINRVLVDHLSAKLFTPSQAAVDNLAREGITGDSVAQVGDVMFDAVLTFTEVAREKSTALADLGLDEGSYVLSTLHRKENTDDRERLASILDGFAMSGATVVLPLHPRTRKMLAEFGLSVPANVRIVDPVGYLDMMMLQRSARLIATDSGGMQKEAYFHGVPCVTMRDETEWVELVDLGVNQLVGADGAAIAAAIENARPVETDRSVYGDGRTAAKVADLLVG